MESQLYGTPVLGADIGGIPELIRVGQTGELFESGNPDDLKQKLTDLWQNQEKTAAYADNCRQNGFFTAEEYIDTMFRHCGK